jgi:hypothetical protein
LAKALCVEEGVNVAVTWRGVEWKQTGVEWRVERCEGDHGGGGHGRKERLAGFTRSVLFPVLPL